MRKPKLPKSKIHPNRTQTRSVDQSGGDGVVVSPGKEGVLRGVQRVEVERRRESVGSDEQIAWDVLRKVTDRPVMNPGHQTLDLTTCRLLQVQLWAEFQGSTEDVDHPTGQYYIRFYDIRNNASIRIVLPKAALEIIKDKIGKLV